MDEESKLEAIQQLKQELENLQQDRQEVQKKFVEMMEDLIEEEIRLFNSQEWQKLEDLVDKEKELLKKLKDLQA
jgi:HPt (histidine-containing phosphotransfer) domain-containing protein